MKLIPSTTALRPIRKVMQGILSIRKLLGRPIDIRHPYADRLMNWEVVKGRMPTLATCNDPCKSRYCIVTDHDCIGRGNRFNEE